MEKKIGYRTYMLKKKSNIALYVSPIVVVVLFLVTFFGVKIPHSVSTLFEVTPAQKWILSKGSQGQIVSNIIDFKTAISNNYSAVLFERGESMDFKLVQSIVSKSNLLQGDTVGIIHSSYLQERLSKLNSDLLIAQADLAAKSTGEKQALIDEAKNKIRFTEAKIQEKTLLFERYKELFKKEYISKEQYDAAYWELKQSEIEREINKAQLEVLTTGIKSEELRILKSTIDSYSNEIRLLKSRLNDFNLLAPISGEIVKDFSQDTMLIVNNRSQLILTAPIRYENMRYFTEGETVHVELQSISKEISGTIVSLSKEVKILNGVQILYLRILLDSPEIDLVPGLFIRGEIVLPKITIKEYLFSLFTGY
jgi:hypothetical protein